ncbi:hypothetical protein [Microbacterium sp. ABRD28]|uniref:hypothetical protein n=1 Tax=Microbacterium sp. ABRD28 TaxID=2268461 RepID=UPI0013DDC7AE|nr:hypothetical protein [Microbacterium sp. ABRD28]
MTSRLPLLLSLASLGILFLSIVFVFLLVIGSYFGIVPFTETHESSDALAQALSLVA